MRTWTMLLCLVHSSLVLLEVVGKRHDPMVDPLARRSPLDKNFMRFGRSSPAFTEEEETDDTNDSSTSAGTDKEDNFLRSMRGKNNFMRFGRAKNDNFMRFGRGKQDNFMRFGKAKADNFMRFGRFKQDNYMRFGRGKQDSFMRFGRGKQDNFMRFGRGKGDNFMRFGRGKQDSFMRFGRGKQDNYLRFGRDGFMNDVVEDSDFSPAITSDRNWDSDLDFIRDLRGKHDNYMRFGRNGQEYISSIPLTEQSSNSKVNSQIKDSEEESGNVDGRFDNSAWDLNSPEATEDAKDSEEPKHQEKESYSTLSNDAYLRQTRAKEPNLVRFGRHTSHDKNDGFMRFGRDSGGQPEENPQESELIPQRLKRSISNVCDPPDKMDPLKDEVNDYTLHPLSQLSEDTKAENSFSRGKRSIIYKSSTPPSLSEQDSDVDFVTAKLRFDSPTKHEYQSALITAGLPNIIVGPEFSLLPNLDPSTTSFFSKTRSGDQNFIRLG